MGFGTGDEEDDGITEDKMAMLSAITLDDVIEEGSEDEELDDDEEALLAEMQALEGIGEEDEDEEEEDMVWHITGLLALWLAFSLPSHCPLTILCPA